jgi:hypothetical protein
MNHNTFLLVSFLVLGANAFVTSPTALHKNYIVHKSSTSDDDSEMFQGILDDADNSIMDQMDIMNELSWRLDRSKLEEQEQNRFRKRIQSKPWKLPYNDARKWVQANLGIDTEAEYYDLVANGNLRTPYIPKNPEKYYSEDGSWISWKDFLKGDTQ